MDSLHTSPAQDSRLAVITGTGGLGYQTAIALARSGMRVILAGRNPAKGAEAIDALRLAVPGADVAFEPLDLASLQSVSAFAARLRQNGEPIAVLVNNAGIMSPPSRETTREGHEVQLGVNHLGHFALTAGLLPLLRGGGRVVSVTSLAQHYARLNLDTLRDEAAHHGGRAYCDAKLLQALFAVELQCRSDRSGWGITSTAAHPGFATTNLFQGGQGKASLRSFISTRVIAPLIGHSAEAGALPIIHAATSSDVIGGRLYGPKGFKEMKGPPGECAFAKPVHDAGLREKAWAISEEMTCLRFDGAAT